MKQTVTLGTFSPARVLVAGLALCIFIFGIVACGGGGGGSASATPPGGGGAGSAGLIFVANPNSGHLNSYSYTTTGTISGLVNTQSPSSFSSSPNIELGVDTTNGLVFLGTSGTSTNNEWSYLYGTTGQMSGGLSSAMNASGTPYGGVFDTLNHFAISTGSTGIQAFSYAVSTGAVSNTASSTSANPPGQIINADFTHHLVFSYSGTTVSSYSLSPTEAISGTANSNVTVSALTGATNVDSATDTTNGIVFLIIQNGSGSSIVPIPYNTTTGAFGTPAATTSFTSTGISTACRGSGGGQTSGVDPANHLLFVQDNSNGNFGIYGYNATTGAVGMATLSFALVPGSCASVDTGNRILFFLVNSATSSPYKVDSYTYPAAGTSIAAVNSVSGTATGAGNERLAITNP